MDQLIVKLGQAFGWNWASSSSSVQNRLHGINLDLYRNRHKFTRFRPVEIKSSSESVNFRNGVDVALKNKFVEIAEAAMDEFIKVVATDTFWFKPTDGRGDILRYGQYFKRPCIGMAQDNFISEASRAAGLINITSLAAVEVLMDANRCADMFPTIIGKRWTPDVISDGVGDSRNGAILLMQAELHVISPLVPARTVKFLRHSKQIGEGLWAVVDVSADVFGNSSDAYLRMPSGCLLHDMPYGCCKVTWVEHAYYNENSIHSLYQPYVRSGLAFGAERWISEMQRQCEYIVPVLGEISLLGKWNLGRLAVRMTRDFCSGINGNAEIWEVVHVGNLDGTTRLMKNNRGARMVLSVATSVWMPVPHGELFASLQNEDLRGHWDVLAAGCSSAYGLHCKGSGFSQLHICRFPQ